MFTTKEYRVQVVRTNGQVLLDIDCGSYRRTPSQGAVKQIILANDYDRVLQPATDYLIHLYRRSAKGDRCVRYSSCFVNPTGEFTPDKGQPGRQLI